MAENSQHIEIPHNLGGEFKLRDLDYFIYGELKRHMNWKTYETFVSQAFLAEKASCSIPTIADSLNRLKKSGEISIINKRGLSNNYKIRKDGGLFEMISYELIKSEILDPELKGFYYRYQALCYKNKETGFATCSYSNNQLAKLMKINVRTLKSRFKKLEELNIMTTSVSKMPDPSTGLMNNIRLVDLEAVCQLRLYVDGKFDLQDKRMAAQDRRIYELEEKLAFLTREKFKQENTIPAEYDLK